jgi:tetratricopeptide (TPR) repeat protein
LTWWGANALGYAFGYSDYYNPYYTEGMPAYYTEPIITEPVYYTEPVAIPPVQYAEPIPATPVQPVQPAAAAPAPAVAAPPAAAPLPAASSDALAKFDQARDAFREGRYQEALKLTDEAVAQMPRDAVLHEFRSLVLFALGRYPESAAAIHAVLDVGPGWDWKTLSGLYASIDAYTSQLRALEAARDKDPKSAALHFLLAYHYLTCGHSENALKELRRTLEIQPQDAVAGALLASLSPRDAQPAQPPAQPPAAAPPGQIAPEAIVGDWTAAGKGAGKYSMSLSKDGSFTWGFSRGTRKQEVKGVQTLEGNVLAMEPDSGGIMLAELSVKGPDNLHFKMIGGKSDDPGLDFQRQAPKQGN